MPNSFLSQGWARSEGWGVLLWGASLLPHRPGVGDAPAQGAPLPASGHWLASQSTQKLSPSISSSPHGAEAPC